MRRRIVATFLDAHTARTALGELSKAGLSAAAANLKAERDAPEARSSRMRQETEDLIVGPGVAVPGTSGRAAAAGAVWGAVVGAVAGLIGGLIATGGAVGLAVAVATGCAAVAGSVFGAVWSGGARADEEAEKTELVEERGVTLTVDVADRAAIMRAVHELKKLGPDSIGVVDSHGRPLDDETDEALWVREA